MWNEPVCADKILEESHNVSSFFFNNHDTQGHEVSWNIGNTPDSYSGADWFESGPKHRYPDQRFSWFSQSLQNIPRLGHGCFLPTPFQFSIH
jgi:hypothetical protein